MTLSGGPGAKDNEQLKGLVASLPTVVVDQTAVVGDIYKHLEDPGNEVTITLTASSVETKVKKGGSTSTSTMKWG